MLILLSQKSRNVKIYLVAYFGVSYERFESLDFRSKFPDEFNVWILQKEKKNE